MKLAGFEVGNSKPIFLITGPCVSEPVVLDVVAKLSVDWK
jgi:3-deoxy-D-manno-octulosonic acid (KDO) 8-phosphate synthase